ncbi:MAG: transposase [Candidatus Competibacteraceae bacterium]|nr:transposase [Candidatus Competibacteraceae bacterium]
MGDVHFTCLPHSSDHRKIYRRNYFTHRFTTSIIEGINNSIKTVKRMGYGFRNFSNFKQRVLMYFA